MELINLLRGLSFLFQRIINGKKKRIFNKEFNLFVSFFSYIDKKKFKNNEYNSLYWGNLKKVINNNFLHLYIKNNLNYNFNKSNQKLNKISKEIEIHNFLDLYLDKKIFFKILFNSIKIKCRFHFLKKNLNINIIILKLQIF